MSVSSRCPACNGEVEVTSLGGGGMAKCNGCGQIMPAFVKAGAKVFARTETEQKPTTSLLPSEAGAAVVDEAAAARPVAPQDMRTAEDLPSAANGGEDLVGPCRKAFRGLALYAFLLASLAALAGGVLLFVEVDGSDSTAGVQILRMLAMAFALVWLAIGFAALRQSLWAVYPTMILAGVNLIGGFITLTGGFRGSVTCGLLLNFGLLAQAEKALKIVRRMRFSLTGRPDLRLLAERRDVFAVLRLLRGCSEDDAAAALQAIGSMGDAASPAVPALVGVVLQGAPPAPEETDCCVICRQQLRVWNRAFGTQLCGKCSRLLQTLRSNPENVRPSLAQLAAQALGQIGSAAQMAIPALQRASKSQDRRLAQAAEHALNRISSGAKGAD